MKNLASKISVSFFPVPLPEELLDSVVYRYQRLSGASNPVATIEHLFGKKAIVAPKLLTNSIDIFWERAAQKLFLDADDLINRLTLLPAFGAILDKSQMRSARHASHEGLGVGMGPLYRSPIRVIESDLQSCPMCVNEELDRLGVAYWHRSHQLDGVKVCHRHGCDLHSACRHCSHPIRRPRSMDLPQPFCQSCKKPQFALFSYPESVKRLAILANQALQGEMPFCDRRLLARRIRDVIGDDTAEACDGIRALYGPRYINSFPNGFYSAHSDWLEHGFRFRSTLRGPESDLINLPSLGHMLMLVDFLFGTWDTLSAKVQRKALVA